MSKQTLRVAIAQIAPVWLDRQSTVDKMLDYIANAASESADLVAFGEALLPGYPFWVERTSGAEFESPLQKEIYAHYVDQSVDIGKGDLESLCKAAAAHQVACYVGIMERDSQQRGHSLYCSMVYIDKLGEIQSVHRKLMPTHEERLVWSIGDGNGLRTHPLGAFTVGGLNCWENWMPLARASLYGQGEDLHVAIWPGSLRNTEDITRYIARESRSYVLSVSGLMRKSDIPGNIPQAELLQSSADDVMANGGSCLAAPTGEWVIEPVVGEEMLVVATIDHEQVRRERHSFNASGHYSRPDVTRLVVNRARQSTVELEDDQAG